MKWLYVLGLCTLSVSVSAENLELQAGSPQAQFDDLHYRLGYDVYFLPLLYYNQYFKGDDLFNALYSFIKNIDPNVILWWNWESDKDVLIKLKKNYLRK